MNVLRIVVDDSEARGARAEGRAYIGSYCRIVVLGGSFAGLSAGVSIADEDGNDVIGFQALDQYGGGRSLAGNVLFDRSDMQHLLDAASKVRIVVNVCDSSGNVHCSAETWLYNSSASAV